MEYERTSDNGGVDHFHHKVKNDEDMVLTKEEAKEQLLWEMRDQIGEITFRTGENENGTPIVYALINGREADAYLCRGE